MKPTAQLEGNWMNRPAEAMRKISPFPPLVGSDQLGWQGLHALRFRNATSKEETSLPAFHHHGLILMIKPPEDLNLRYEGVRRGPMPVGSISLMPARRSASWQWTGSKDSLHIYLEPSRIAQVAAESFELDPKRMEVPPLDGLDAPELRAAMLAVNTEMTTGGMGGPLMVESLANILSVHLIRRITGPRCPAGRTDGKLPKWKLQRVVNYIMDNLEDSPTLEQMAAIARLSPYHFSRQFKITTGLPPHQYVIARRVERAQELLRKDNEIGLARVALQVGFSDQSQFSFHFKRMVGVTPSQFRK
jgi:AraC family transcriptional regulator